MKLQNRLGIAIIGTDRGSKRSTLVKLLQRRRNRKDSLSRFLLFCCENPALVSPGPAAATAANIRLITILITFRSHSPYYVIYIRLISLRNTNHQPRSFSLRIHFLSLPLLDNFLVAASIFCRIFYFVFFFLCVSLFLLFICASLLRLAADIKMLKEKNSKR